MARTAGVTDENDRYAFRLFEPPDRKAFLSLYDGTFGGGSEEWFEWKYVENPATEHVPIVVATRGDELVGARPCVPFRMRVGDRTESALRFGDTMVHPDHRRRGLFTRMTRRTVEYYAALDPAFAFNHPNEFSLPGYRLLGGRVIGRDPIAYRIQNPAALIEGRADGPAARGLWVATPLVRAYLDGRECLARDADPEITVTRHDSIPAETLAALYRTDPAEGIHAERSVGFYEWRFRNPRWEYATYVARGDGPLAAIVTGSGRLASASVTTLTEVVPMAGNGKRKAAFSALIERILDAEEETDLLAYSGRAIPEPVLRAVGFHRDGTPPLSWLANATVLVAHELGDGACPEWRVNGVSLLEESNWSLSFCEQDAR